MFDFRTLVIKDADKGFEASNPVFALKGFFVCAIQLCDGYLDFIQSDSLGIIDRGTYEI